MKLLAKLSNETFGLKGEVRDDDTYKVRKAARAVIFNSKGEIAVQKIERDGFYKLPGGGVEVGESIKECLRREILEEVGCEIVIGKEVGEVVEYRNEYNVLQYSYVWLAEVFGEVGDSALVQEEIDEGMIPMWMMPEDAMRALENSDLSLYKAKFIVARDTLILKEAMRLRG